MQIVENKRTVFFNDGATDVIAPGIAAIIASARQIVAGEFFVILGENLRIHRLVVIFVHKHRRWHTRLEIRVICRPAEAQAKQR
ncbi:hypothetical protein D3C72_1845290 [compost metagenome]